MTCRRPRSPACWAGCLAACAVLCACRGRIETSPHPLDATASAGESPTPDPATAGECTMRCLDDRDCALLYTTAHGKKARIRYEQMHCQRGWCRDTPKEQLSPQQRATAARHCASRADCCRDLELSMDECASLYACREGRCTQDLACSAETCRGDLRFSPYRRAVCAAGTCTFPCSTDADCTHFPNHEARFRHSDVCWAGRCAHRCTTENCDFADQAKLHPRGMGCAPK